MATYKAINNVRYMANDYANHSYFIIHHANGIQPPIPPEYENWAIEWSQDSKLFDGTTTITFNLYNPGASDEQIDEYAKFLNLYYNI